MIILPEELPIYRFAFTLNKSLCYRSLAACKVYEWRVVPGVSFARVLEDSISCPLHSFALFLTIYGQCQQVNVLMDSTKEIQNGD
jgi:hypothetical protein